MVSQVGHVIYFSQGLLTSFIHFY